MGDDLTFRLSGFQPKWVSDLGLVWSWVICWSGSDDDGGWVWEGERGSEENKWKKIIKNSKKNEYFIWIKVYNRQINVDIF